MDWVFKDMKNVDPYIDNIIIGSTGDTWEEMLTNHERDVRRTLDKLAEQELLVSWKKAQLFVQKMEYCGHVMENGTRTPSPGKLLAIQKWELPRTVTQLRWLLGCCNYYSWYVKNYAQEAGQLHSKLQLSRHDGRKGSKLVQK